ncbi:MAG TPA: heat-inducible transcriptional repressor HrcA [Actinomycetota bacterium]
MTIEERKAAVLRAVVRDHIRTGEPVGSKTIVSRYGLGVSAATIRNELAMLEDLGYLTQPHTSAGRIPTDLGYRFYVDSLPETVALPRTLQDQIETFFGPPAGDVDEVLHGTASLLSRLTGYAAVAVTPRATSSRVLRTELVPVGSSVMLLIVSDTGRVDKRMLEVGHEPDERIVERASRMLSERLVGLSYDEAARRAAALIREMADEERRLVRDVASAIRHMGDASGEIYLGGVANIADEAAFESPDTLREMVGALEEGSAVLEILRAASGAIDDVTVRIGRENTLRAMAEASVVLAWYGPRSRPVGAIAVVGPTRMEYPKAISSTRVVAGHLSDLLRGLAG